VSRPRSQGGGLRGQAGLSPKYFLPLNKGEWRFGAEGV
jgi:hypothetical protein